MPTTKTESTTEVHESFIDENGIPQQRNGSGPVVDLEVLPQWQAYKQNPWLFYLCLLNPTKMWTDKK